MFGERAGEEREDNGLAMTFVWCPRGFVSMEQVEQVMEPVSKPDDGNEADDAGSQAADAVTREKVTPVKAFLTRGYWLGRYEVTQAEWTKIVGTEPWKGQNYVKEGADSPATYVNWNETMEFCKKLTEHERKSGRLPDGWEYTLPTEAQWERACRAQTETVFSFGNDESNVGEYAWFWENAWKAGEQFPRAVGRKKPNPWNLNDMHGNVWEWCRDSWCEKLPGGRDPEVSREESRRVMRGGSSCDLAILCRSAYRFGRAAAVRGGDLGFRVALCSVR